MLAESEQRGSGASETSNCFQLETIGHTSQNWTDLTVQSDVLNLSEHGQFMTGWGRLVPKFNARNTQMGTGRPHPAPASPKERAFTIWPSRVSATVSC